MTVTATDVSAAAAALKFKVPVEHEEDYLKLLETTEKAAKEVMAMPDYTPPVDFTRFPRINTHRSADADNELCGWAWKSTIVGAAEGPLKGRTVCAKDTVCVAGVPQLFGTDAFTDFTPEVDATLITRLLEAGATFVGKATCKNFSHGASSFSSPYSPVENPYAKGFSTGGSSSGCGALLAAGEVDMGIGGDQGGSIRIPASLCGIVGHKPTFGLVPYTSVLSSCPAVDTVGPMARNVLDTAILVEAIASCNNIDDRQVGAPVPALVPHYAQLVLDARTNKDGLKGLKIGILKEGFEIAGMDLQVADLVKRAVRKFEELGARVGEVSIPLHSKTGTLSHIINKYGSAQTRQGRQVGRKGLYVNSYWTKLIPWNQNKYDKAKYFVTGTAMSAEYGWANYPIAYGKAMNIARQLRDQFDAALTTYDVLVMPTVPQPARRHVGPTGGPLSWATAAPGIVSNTAAFNLTGHPSLTIPCGFVSPHPADVLSEEDSKIRLPVGMMLVAKMFDDATALKAGDAWEQAVDWRKF